MDDSILFSPNSPPRRSSLTGKSPGQSPQRTPSGRAPRSVPGSAFSGAGVENATEAARIQLDAVVTQLEETMQELQTERERADHLQEALREESSVRRKLETDLHDQGDAILQACEGLVRLDVDARGLLNETTEGRELPQCLLKLVKRVSIREADHGKTISELEDQISRSQARIRELENIAASSSFHVAPPQPPPPPPAISSVPSSSAAANSREEEHRQTKLLMRALREERQMLVEEIRKLGNAMASSSPTNVIGPHASSIVSPRETRQGLRSAYAHDEVPSTSAWPSLVTDSRRFDRLEHRMDELQQSVSALLRSQEEEPYSQPAIRKDWTAEKLLRVGERLYEEWDKTRTLMLRLERHDSRR